MRSFRVGRFSPESAFRIGQFKPESENMLVACLCKAVFLLQQRNVAQRANLSLFQVMQELAFRLPSRYARRFLFRPVGTVHSESNLQ
jgi:hypothetical protein